MQANLISSTNLKASLFYSYEDIQNRILRAFINVGQLVLAGDLSESGPVGDKTPNVILARQNGIQPDYPFVQLDIISIADTDGYLLSEFVNDVNQVVYDTHTKYMLQYVVYGGNATALANKLNKAFRRDFIIHKISRESKGELEQVFPVDSVPSTLSTVNYEVASFNLTFNINDRYLDTDVGVFDTINLTGELNKVPDDLQPLELDISVTSNSLS